MTLTALTLLLPWAQSHDILLDEIYGVPSEGRYESLMDSMGMRAGEDPFRQLHELLPTPNELRLASGAPGPAYWQNEADHLIEVTLDPERHELTGWERITYFNESPHTLEYLWLQLDGNQYLTDSMSSRMRRGPDLTQEQNIRFLERLQASESFEAGTRIQQVQDRRGRPLEYQIIDTMMRVELPAPLKSGGSFSFEVDWKQVITPDELWGRSQVEILDDGAPLYEVAQWFPRMAAYTDTDGWQHKPFLGHGEFTLEFGDYELYITVPDTYVVAATGELQNPRQVLTETQRARLQSAEEAAEPVMVITQEEADAQRLLEAEGTKTWHFKADRVRDVAWAASASFLWDAWGVEVPGSGDQTLAMSYWPSEGEPLWSRYSTQAVAHTVEVFSEHVLPYPYPVAISVNGPVGGMEYPMICFNGPRPEEDGTYSKRTKYGLIGVIIHEVGHNWFPMIINSDERQWTWMDEGLNTYVEFLAEQVWEEKYPSWRGEPENITGYMSSDNSRPIMTNSESLLQFGNNAYAKPATALNVLRETVLGREQMDHAMRAYGERWAFKRPQPADLFRTLEDVSGTDLDWFFRGWFYTNGHVDLAIERVRRFELARDPEQRKGFERAQRDERPKSLSDQRNASLSKRTQDFPELVDFYNDFDELDVTPEDERAWEAFLDELEDSQREAFDTPWVFYSITLRNEGELVMPVPLRIMYEDGEEELLTLPAEIWAKNDEEVEKVLVRDRSIAWVELDPFRELADVDDSNNRWPPQIETSLVRITTRPEIGNPLRTHLKEEARAEGQLVLEGFAGELRDAWESARAEGTTTPQQASAQLLSLSGVVEARDPWERPFVIELSDDEDSYRELAEGALELDEVPIAVVRSSGQDGEPDTPDDLRWRVMADGSVAP